jgi:membrane fusion protein (multidrug efflux system)
VIVTLQQLDPEYVDFFVPQKSLGQVQVGRNANLTLDAFPGKAFPGTVNAVNPRVDTDTRNVLVEARVPNPDRILSPGMFVNVTIDAGSQRRYLTLPQTAVVFNPYGETVYVVRTKREFDADQAAAAVAARGADAADRQPAPKKASRGPPPLPPDALVVQQTFVTTGLTRGDQVAILTGLNEGVEVVTSGQIKLKNGAPVSIDNSVKPANNPNPTPQEGIATATAAATATERRR